MRNPDLIYVVLFFCALIPIGIWTQDRAFDHVYQTVSQAQAIREIHPMDQCLDSETVFKHEGVLYCAETDSLDAALWEASIK